MSKLLGWLASTTIGAAIVTVTPALAFQGGGFGGGMGGMRMSRQVFVGGAPRWLGVINSLAGRDIDHALCPLVQVTRAFGGLGHLLRRHVAAHLNIASLASLSASRRVA